MSQEPADTVSDVVEASSVPDGANPLYPPSRLAGLAPKWLPGQSGNPSGLTKDGRPTKSTRRILEDKLNEHEQRSLRQLVHNWVKAANRGSAKHLEMILQRIDPVETGTEGRVVLEGLKLELHVGSDARNTASESHGGASVQSDLTTTQSELPRDVPLLEASLGVPPSTDPLPTCKEAAVELRDGDAAACGGGS